MSLDPLAQIHLLTILAVAAIACGTLLMLRRICLVPLIEVMERRRARIETAQGARAEAEQRHEAARVALEQALEAARQQAEHIVGSGREDLSRLRAERLARAGSEAEAILAHGREEAQALRQVEAARLRAELGECTTRTLARMVDQVDAAAVRLVVSRVLGAQEAG